MYETQFALFVRSGALIQTNRPPRCYHRPMWLQGRNVMWEVGQTGAHSRFGGVSRNKRAVSSFARPTRLFFASPSVSHSDSVGALALPESLVEALAQRDVRLALGALQELLDLPRARTLRLL